MKKIYLSTNSVSEKSCILKYCQWARDETRKLRDSMEHRTTQHQLTGSFSFLKVKEIMRQTLLSSCTTNNYLIGHYKGCI